jgi:PKD repeat protein
VRLKIFPLLWTVLSALTLLMLSACGGPGQALAPTPAGSASFALDVLPQTFEGGAGGRFSVATRTVGDNVEATVSVENARDLRAAYFDLAYDAAHYHPVGASARGLLAHTDKLLTMSVLDQPGTVSHGQAVLGDGAGFSGNGVVATVQFAPGPARAASQAPQTNASRGTVSWDPTTRTLSWYYFNQGDYDQNGETNIADLSPLSKYFKQTGPFAPNSIREVVDGDGNGEINIADLTPIAANFKASAEGYKIYKSTNQADIPTENGAPSSLPEVDEVPFASAQGDRQNQRLQFSYTMPPTNAGDYFWVRPYDGSGGVGTPFGSAGGDQDLTIRIVNEPPVGEGTETDPFILDPQVEYQVEVMHSTVGDVSTDSETAYTVDANDAGTLTNSDAILRVAETFAGDFTISGTWQGVLAQPELNYCRVQQDQPDNQPPTVSLDADTTIGDLPLVVEFLATAVDDGSVITYEWDWNGDGIFDENSGTGNLAYHTFDTAGTFVVTVRGTDEGGLSATAEITIIVHEPGGENEPPVAIIEADNFDGSWSYDLDGDIVKFEWDFESDGTWDAEGMSATHTYDTAGIFQVSLRVTDDYGDMDQISRTITAATSNWNVSTLSTGGMYGGWPQLNEVGGEPAVIYYHEDSLEGTYEARYRRFNGTAWGAETTISAGLEAITVTDSAVVDGNPAAVFQAGGDNWGLYYVRASDAQGGAWGAPQMIGDGTYLGYGQMQIVEGNPAVAFANEDVDFNGSVMYTRSGDAEGNSWPTAQVIPGSNAYYPVKVTFDLVDGRPAILYNNEDSNQLQIFQATDSLGDIWDAARVLRSDWYSTTSLFAGSKIPTLVWQGPEFHLNFATATDMQATDFNAPQVMDEEVEQYADDYSPRMAWVDDGAGTEVPAIAYFKQGQPEGDVVPTFVMYVQATNPEGTAWLAPETVYTSSFGCMQIDIQSIAGKPHLAFSDGATGEVIHATPK